MDTLLFAEGYEVVIAPEGMHLHLVDCRPDACIVQHCLKLLDAEVADANALDKPLQQHLTFEQHGQQLTSMVRLHAYGCKNGDMLCFHDYAELA